MDLDSIESIPFDELDKLIPCRIGIGAVEVHLDIGELAVVDDFRHRRQIIKDIDLHAAQDERSHTFLRKVLEIFLLFLAIILGYIFPRSDRRFPKSLA